MSLCVAAGVFAKMAPHFGGAQPSHSIASEGNATRRKNHLNSWYFNEHTSVSRFYPWAISKNDVDTVAIVKLRYTDGVALMAAYRTTSLHMAPEMNKAQRIPLAFAEEHKCTSNGSSRSGQGKNGSTRYTHMMLAELSCSTNGGRGKLQKIALLGDNSKSKINHKTVNGNVETSALP
ncbi:hypothetical protein D5086_000572 [Populus alba]|uniref:Uncharacterized protein n=1 Tax=Populus alba TaxID=43335 RepID=A0ACC4CXF0_POPAL